MDYVVGYEAIQTTNQQPNSFSILILALSHTTALWGGLRQLMKLRLIPDKELVDWA